MRNIDLFEIFAMSQSRKINLCDFCTPFPTQSLRLLLISLFHSSGFRHERIANICSRMLKIAKRFLWTRVDNHSGIIRLLRHVLIYFFLIFMKLYGSWGFSLAISFLAFFHRKIQFEWNSSIYYFRQRRNSRAANFVFNEEDQLWCDVTLAAHWLAFPFYHNYQLFKN